MVRSPGHDFDICFAFFLSPILVSKLLAKKKKWWKIEQNFFFLFLHSCFFLILILSFSPPPTHQIYDIIWVIWLWEREREILSISAPNFVLLFSLFCCYCCCHSFIHSFNRFVFSISSANSHSMRLALCMYVENEMELIIMWRVFWVLNENSMNSFYRKKFSFTAIASY